MGRKVFKSPWLLLNFYTLTDSIIDSLADMVELVSTYIDLRRFKQTKINLDGKPAIFLNEKGREPFQLHVDLFYGEGLYISQVGESQKYFFTWDHICDTMGLSKINFQSKNSCEVKEARMKAKSTVIDMCAIHSYMAEPVTIEGHAAKIQINWDKEDENSFTQGILEDCVTKTKYAVEWKVVERVINEERGKFSFSDVLPREKESKIAKYGSSMSDEEIKALAEFPFTYDGRIVTITEQDKDGAKIKVELADATFEYLTKSWKFLRYIADRRGGEILPEAEPAIEEKKHLPVVVEEKKKEKDKDKFGSGSFANKPSNFLVWTTLTDLEDVAKKNHEGLLKVMHEAYGDGKLDLVLDLQTIIKLSTKMKVFLRLLKDKHAIKSNWNGVDWSSHIKEWDEQHYGGFML